MVGPNLRHLNLAPSRMRKVAERRAWRDTGRYSRGARSQGVLVDAVKLRGKANY